MGRSRSARFLGSFVSYTVFIAWALITILPLFWMGYSSFKSNEELTLDIYRFPHDLFDNAGDVYEVIPKAVNLVYPYDPDVDTRERLIIESTTIMPGRRIMVHFLLKSELPPEIANLPVGSRITVSQLPAAIRAKINWDTIWFNYRSAFVRGGLSLKFLNSIIYSGVSTFLIVLLSLMLGFAVSKMGFPKLSMFFSGLIGLGYLISINSVIIPLFLMLTSLKLTDTHVGIILVYTAFGIPMGFLLAAQFIRGLPDSLMESAYMDGATVFQTFRKIIVPMSTPVIVTISIMQALGIWNEFLLVLVFASSEATKSLPVGVFSFSSMTTTQLGWQLAALVIAVAPVMVVYFIFNRRLAEGVVGGALKG